MAYTQAERISQWKNWGKFEDQKENYTNNISLQTKGILESTVKR